MNIKGNYLHLLLKRTKRDIPHHKTIGPNRYPMQDLQYLNCRKMVLIKDDYRIIPEDAPDYRKYSDPQVRNTPCTIIRYDKEDPWIAVYVAENYEFVAIGSSLEPSAETATTYPLIYPIQHDKNDDDIIGCYGTMQTGYINNDNMLETFDYPGVIIRSDISEPALDVIIGQFSDEEYQVFLSSEIWLDVIGNIITDPVMDAKVKTLAVREQVLEGRTPYGFNQNRIPNDEERDSEEG